MGDQVWHWVFFRLISCYLSDLPNLIPLEIVSDLIFSAVTLMARASSKGDPVHSCHISLYLCISVISVDFSSSVHIRLWRGKVKDQFKTANTFLQIHIWQYCKWVNIANMYWLLFLLQPANPKLFAKYSGVFVNDTSYCLMLHELYQFTVNLTCSESVICSTEDSAPFNNRFCNFPFNPNLAEKQTANSETSSYGYLPCFRELSIS